LLENLFKVGSLVRLPAPRRPYHEHGLGVEDRLQSGKLRRRLRIEKAKFVQRQLNVWIT
jgi:hypothetical protein